MTTKRLLSAKSTSARIIQFPLGAVHVSGHSLIDRVLEHKRIRDDLLTRLYSAHYFLPIAGYSVSARDFHASELVVRRREIDIVAIMDVQDGGGRNQRAHFRGP